MRSRLPIPVFLVATLAASAASAGGSIGLDDILSEVAAGTPALVADIEKALKSDGRAAADVGCVADIRLGNQWVELGGMRLVPITCEIGGRTLRIDGTVTFRDAKGRVLREIGPKTFRNAVTVEQTNLKWTWK